MPLPFSYHILRSGRKTLGIELKNGEVLVRAPRFVSKAQIEAALFEKRPWIEKNLPKSAPQPDDAPPLTKDELRDLAAKAKADIPPRVQSFAEQLGVSYGRVTIRAQHTRWGSCSSKGNLNFNCLLMLTPEEVRDSVVVHELCHRLEMNHSPRFYALVRGVLPDYDRRHGWLKTHGGALLRRLGDEKK